MLAMSAGVPVVASRVGGLPEAISNGEDGLLVENTSEAISEGIKRLLEDGEFAREVTAKARRKVELQFTEDRMVDRTRGVYGKLLGDV